MSSATSADAPPATRFGASRFLASDAKTVHHPIKFRGQVQGRCKMLFDFGVPQRPLGLKAPHAQGLVAYVMAFHLPSVQASEDLNPVSRQDRGVCDVCSGGGLLAECGGFKFRRCPLPRASA